MCTPISQHTYIIALEIITYKFKILVPTPGFEPGKAYGLNVETVPICICQVGIFISGTNVWNRTIIYRLSADCSAIELHWYYMLVPALGIEPRLKLNYLLSAYYDFIRVALYQY